MKLLLILALVCCAPFSQAADRVKVKGYIKKDGTVVAPHERSRPNAYKWDNDDYKPSQKPLNDSFKNPMKNHGADFLTPNPNRFLDDNPYNDSPNLGGLGTSPRARRKPGAGTGQSFLQDEPAPTFEFRRKEKKATWSDSEEESPAYKAPSYRVPKYKAPEFKSNYGNDSDLDSDANPFSFKRPKAKVPSYGQDDDSFGSSNRKRVNTFGQDDEPAYKAPTYGAFKAPMYPSYETPAYPAYRPPTAPSGYAPPSYEYKAPNYGFGSDSDSSDDE